MNRKELRLATEAQRHGGMRGLRLLLSFRTSLSGNRFISIVRKVECEKSFLQKKDRPLTPFLHLRNIFFSKRFEVTGLHFNFSLLVFLFLFSISIFSQTTEPTKEEKKEKTNIEIMQENEANVERDRAAREKEPLTGYDAETNSKRAIKEINDRNSNFWVVGGSIGSPSGGNINAGYYFRDFVLRVSGMRYSSHWNGLQGDIGYAFWKTSVVAHSFSLVFGQMNMRPFNPQIGQGGQNKYDRDGIVGYDHDPPTLMDNLIRAYVKEQDPNLALALEYQYRTRQYANFHQQYIGLTYDILVGGFFLQLGMGYGRGDYRNPQLLLQMGYLFDFGRKAD